MLGVTDRDRQEIRTGRNRAIGARYAGLLFWGPIIGYAAVIVVAAAVVAWVVFEVHAVWVGGLDRTVYGAGPLALLGLAFLAGIVALAFPRSPRRRRSRRRRR